MSIESSNSKKKICVNIKNDINKIISALLDDYPDYGMLSVTLYFHNAILQRVVTSKEVSTLKNTTIGEKYE